MVTKVVIDKNTTPQIKMIPEKQRYTNEHSPKTVRKFYEIISNLFNYINQKYHRII